jgi:hypothetical protein
VRKSTPTGIERSTRARRAWKGEAMTEYGNARTGKRKPGTGMLQALRAWDEKILGRHLIGVGERL